MMKTTLRVVAAATGFSALALQYWLEVHLPKAPGLFVSTINFFSYFTILANAAAAFAMLVPLVAPNGSMAHFLSKPSVRTAIAAYLIVVAVTYYAVLRFVGDDYGLERIADRLMHYVTPLLFLTDWVAFVPKGRVPWTMSPLHCFCRLRMAFGSSCTASSPTGIPTRSSASDHSATSMAWRTWPASWCPTSAPVRQI
jgi:hypothetical protein